MCLSTCRTTRYNLAVWSKRSRLIVRKKAWLMASPLERSVTYSNYCLTCKLSTDLSRKYHICKTRESPSLECFGFTIFAKPRCSLSPAVINSSTGITTMISTWSTTSAASSFPSAATTGKSIAPTLCIVQSLGP